MLWWKETCRTSEATGGQLVGLLLFKGLELFLKYRYLHSDVNSVAGLVVPRFYGFSFFQQ